MYMCKVFRDILTFYILFRFSFHFGFDPFYNFLYHIDHTQSVTHITRLRIVSCKCHFHYSIMRNVGFAGEYNSNKMVHKRHVQPKATNHVEFSSTTSILKVPCACCQRERQIFIFSFLNSILSFTVNALVPFSPPFFSFMRIHLYYLHATYRIKYLSCTFPIQFDACYFDVLTFW